MHIQAHIHTHTNVYPYALTFTQSLLSLSLSVCVLSLALAWCWVWVGVAEWTRQSARQEEAEQLQALLAALYDRYGRAFRRIDFALARILLAMPAAPVRRVPLAQAGWVGGSVFAH
jgi:uncharacterized protein YggT (Ycf19 family)